MGKKWDKLVARIEALEQALGVVVTGRTSKPKKSAKKPAKKKASAKKPKKKAKKGKTQPLPLAGTL